MFKDKHGAVCYTLNVEGWELNVSEYSDHTSAYFAKHTVCGKQVKGKIDHDSWRAYCPKCDIWMPYEVFTILSHMINAINKRMPII